MRRLYVKGDYYVIATDHEREGEFLEQHGYRPCSVRGLRARNAARRNCGEAPIRHLHPQAFGNYLARYPEMLPWYEGLVSGGNV